jgi:hypothetical protein
VRGCFIEWDESTAFDVAEYFDLKETQVNEIVNYCCAVGLFDKELLASGRILTSASIQKRYIEMSTRAKRKDIEIPEQCRIIREESTIIREESKNPPEVCDKVKKSKVKESNPPTPFSAFETNFNLDFCSGKWLELLLKWIEHKKGIEKPVKTQMAIEAFSRDLKMESFNNQEFAEAIIDHTIAHGWGTIVVPDTVRKSIEQQKIKNEKPTKQTVVW